jgi:glycosyltransferase involved in cell wall biosynthesis
MRPLYNLDKIATVATKVCAARRDVYFLFAYLSEAKDAAYEARVHAIVNESQAKERVRFIGAIPHQEMVDHYRLSDVVISIPSTDGTPMSVLEAMACATPVVVSDIPDYDPYYIEPGETVLAAKADEIEALAEALLLLMDDRAFAERLAAEARRRVETTASYQAQMSRMEQLYQSLV